MLTAESRALFGRDGCCVASGGVTDRQLEALRAELDGWVRESAGHAENYGRAYDDRPRFDLEPGHSAEAPRLRRVNNPGEISEAYRAAAFDAPLADMVAELIGPNVKFLHSKINLKLPHTETRVGFHQDFSYVPHSNGDVLTALLMLDDMTFENGCLMAVPGSHQEGQASLWRDGVFTGEVSPEIVRSCTARAVPIQGKAGDVCLMHAELLHGSEPNRSGRARRLFICVYSAADAYPLSPNSLPNCHEGHIVRGEGSHTVRLREGWVELPEEFRMASFFQLQSQHAGA